MERVIKVDLNCREDLTEKYNNNIVSSELISYIVGQAILFSKKENFRIIINNNCNLENDYISLIKEGLDIKYRKSLKKHHINNIKEVFLFIIGILFLFISNLIGDSIFTELFLIVGWVPIWEAIELELFSDNEERRKRFILKKLLSSKFVSNDD